MFWIIIQYIFIVAVSIVAIAYVIKMAKDSFDSKKSCSKGCGCSSGSEPGKQKGK